MRITKFIFLAVVSLAGFVQAQVNEDTPGSTDFPEIGRYPGSFIKSYEHNEYTSFTYPVQTLEYPGGVEEFKASLVREEGERTTIVYEVPTDATNSLLKVFRSIEAGLAKGGFETILSCGGDVNKCGQNFTSYTFGSGFNYSNFKNFKVGDPNKYIYSGTLTKDGDRFIAFIIATKHRDNAINYSIDVVKLIELELEELVLTVDSMEKRIQASGTVMLGGLYFDHNEAALTEESAPTLNVIADYLSKNLGSEYLVVGHTDNQGDLAYNSQLSENRAKSVIVSLKNLLGDESSVTLSPFGAAFAAPVDSNENEDGRASNRRVELVLVNRNNK